MKPKKILFIIAGADFRDAEYFIPAEILKDAGHEIFTASNIGKGMTALGADGGEVPVDYTLAEINPGNFDLIIFVGGPGAPKYMDNEISYGLIRKTLDSGKLLAAICIAPTILAKAGVLNGLKATVWSSALDKKPVKILEENGAIYENKPVVIDRIITAEGPKAAEEFGKTLLKLLG